MKYKRQSVIIQYPEGNSKTFYRVVSEITRDEWGYESGIATIQGAKMPVRRTANSDNTWYADFRPIEA